MGNTYNVLIRKINTVIKKPQTIFIKILEVLSPLLGDKIYIEILFRLKVGYKLNLNNPRTFNEKLQWLKLYYRNPKLIQMVDKYEVKVYIQNTIGEEYVISTLGVWDSFDDIDFENLPDKFVLKTTHDQGGVVICEDKNKFNYSGAQHKLNKHLKRNFYLKYREWPYKDVKPRIIAEEFIGEDSLELKDYKFYCFNGEAKMVFIASGRNTMEKKFDFYDIHFNHLDIKRANTIQSKEGNQIPENYYKMVELAESLSSGLPHVRVDFFNIDGKIYFGELTFFTGAGMNPFYPEKWDYIIGDWIDLKL